MVPTYRERCPSGSEPKNTHARSLRRGRWFTSLLVLSVLFQRRLRRRQPCHRPAQRRTTHAAKPARVQETDRRRVSAVLAADAELERLLLLFGDLAAHLAGKAHERTNASRVDRLERISLEHPLQ